MQCRIFNSTSFVFLAIWATLSACGPIEPSVPKSALAGGSLINTDSPNGDRSDIQVPVISKSFAPVTTVIVPETAQAITDAQDGSVQSPVTLTGDQLRNLETNGSVELNLKEMTSTQKVTTNITVTDAPQSFLQKNPNNDVAFGLDATASNGAVTWTLSVMSSGPSSVWAIQHMNSLQLSFSN